MKRTFAALTAVALAAGLTLAAVVAPASADDSTTPAPAASSTPTTPSSTPSSTPSTAPVVTTTAAASSDDTTTPTATPTPDPTSTPATTDTTDTTTTDAAPVGAAFSVDRVQQDDGGGDGNNNNNNNNPPAGPVYETILWSMAPGNGHAVTITDGSATYPQIKVARVENEHNLQDALKALDREIPDTCGTTYQIDVYIQKDGNVDNSAALDALYASGLAGPNGAQDGKYLASGGLGTAWKYVTNAVCPPCVPDSQITYTYNSANNTGEIVVPNPRGYSGVLCNPIYVTAASWTFDTNGQTWPQTIDQSNHVVGVSGGSNLPISQHGHYKYGATVTCGQGDIYASTTSNAATLFPESYPQHTGHLLGPSNPFSEYFLSDLASYLHFTGSTNPTYMVTGNTCNTVTNPVTPSVDPITLCGHYGSFTIPTTTPNVVYTYNGTVEPAGTVVTGLSGAQTVFATPKSGYKFSGSQSVEYDLALGSYTDCGIVVSDPTVAQPVCTGIDSPNNGSISILTNTFVEYTLTGPGISGGEDFGTSPTNGTIETIGGLGAGVYTVTATGLSGHTVNGQTVYSFPIGETTLTAPECIDLTPNVTWTPASCGPDETIGSTQFNAVDTEVQATVTLPADSNVTYEIDGVSTPAGGPYSLADGSHTVTATLTDAEIALGKKFAANPTVYTLSAGDTVATWSIVIDPGCKVAAAWPASASSTDATCSAGDLGTITLTHLNANEVNYQVVRNSTSAVVYSGTDSVDTVLHLAPGVYTVTPSAVTPGDGISGDAGPYSLTVGAPATVCGNTSLAFTGGTIAWFGFILAGGMLFLGIAFLLIRRRGNRTAE